MISTKEDCLPRFCVDYIFLNLLLKGDWWPILNVQENFDDLIGALFFPMLDLFTEYCQIKLSNGCKEKTTFVCGFGTFRFEVMPFGLINAPATFQQLMCHIVEGFPFVRVYLDYVVMFSKTMEEHIEQFGQVLERI